MDLSQLLAKQRKRAIDRVSSAFDSLAKVRRMLPEELAPYKSSLGWTTTCSIPDQEVILDLLIPNHFPFDPPDVWIRNSEGELWQTNSHVMRSGQLCLFPHSIAIAVDDPAAVAIHCFELADELLRNPDTEGFKSEFSSHWSRHCDEHSYEVVLLDDPVTLGVDSSAVAAKKATFVASSFEKLKSWLDNYTSHDLKLGDPDPLVVAHFDDAMIPAEYPSSALEVVDLLSARAASSSAALVEKIVRSETTVTVLIVQRTEGGPALAAIQIPAIRLGSQSSLVRGFRPGHAPLDVVYKRGSRIVKAQAVERLTVTRADATWIHTRGGKGRDLAQKSVCLIGCGSLGGYVAHLLARAGVSLMTLVDKETLQWENVGRHILGGNDVGLPKASALARRIAEDLPHLTLHAVKKDWRDWCKDEPSALPAHDLVISTTGDWRSEHALNSMARRSEEMPPLVLAWLEPFAVAGHSLTVGRLGGCFACSADPVGVFDKRVALFEADTMAKEPGGCDYYQPYGPVALMPIASMATSAAIKLLERPSTRSELRTWIADESAFSEANAALSPEWASIAETQGFDQLHVQPWPKSPGCALCR